MTGNTTARASASAAPANLTEPWGNRLPPVLLSALLALGYWASTWLVWYFRLDQPGGSRYWLASGIALAGFLLWGRRAAAGIVLGALSAAIHSWTLSAFAVTALLSAVLGPAIIAWWLQRRGDFSVRLDRPQNVLTLLVAGALLGALLQTAIAYSGLALSASGTPGIALHEVAWQALLDAARTALGILLFAPLVLAWAAPSPAAPRDGANLESLGVSVLQALVCVYIFAVHRGHGAYLCLPLALIAALYVSLRWVVLANLLTFAIAALGTLTGHGPFASPAASYASLHLVTFGLVVCLSTLILAALAAERRRVADELEQAAVRFRSLTALSSDWYWEQDEQLRFTMIAGRAADEGRVRPADILGRTRWEIEGSVASAAERTRYDLAVAQREPFQNVVIQEPGSADTPRVISVSGEPVFDDRGGFRGYRGVARDITLERLAARKIEDARLFLGALIETIPSPVLIKDEQHRYLMGNAAFCVFFQRDHPQIVGCTDYDFFPADKAAFFQATDTQALAGHPAHYESTYVINGRTHWMSVQKTALTRPDGTRVVVLLMIDVTERREAEDRLRASEQRFRSLTALSADWYWEQDEQFRFTYVSTDAAGKTITPPSEMVGKTRFELDLEWPSAEAREEHRRTLERHLPYRDLALGDVRSGRQILVSGEPIFDADLRFLGYRGVGRDVTDQRRADRRIARLKDLYAAMTEANEAIIHGHDTGQMLHAICRIAVEYGHFVFARVAMIDQRTGWADTVASAGDDKGLSSRFRFSLDPDIPEGQGANAQSVRAGTNYVCNDIKTEPRNLAWRDLLAEIGVRAQATFLLRQGGRVIGTLHLYAGHIGFFDDELVGMLERLAANISFALDNFQRDEARRAAEAALRESETRFRDFADAAGEYVWETDHAGRITYISSRVLSVWGYSDQELIGRTAAEFMPAGEAERVHEWLAQNMRADGSFRDLEHRIVTRSGESRWLLVNAVGATDLQGNRIGQRGTGRDITDRKTAEARISYLATRDPLTELPNRLLFNDRLEQGIVAARRSEESLALLFIDLDRFKYINDSLGHEVGDMLLKEVATRMHACVRKGDTLSRLGGDEFVVTLEGLQHAEDAAQVAAKIIRTLARPFEIAGHTLTTSCSIGISIFPLDADDDRTLMKNADTAMYHAKEKGRNNYQFFSPEMNVRAVERHSLETALRLAIERQEFVLYYQPQVDIRSGTVVGVEALLRWVHPERGLLAPAPFIAVAEESGLVETIGQWVLRTACERAKAWQEAGYPALKIAVNISARQLLKPREFSRSTTRILNATGLDPKYLELEMTESLLLHNAEENIAVLRKLGKDGVRIAVDDFGTGYSSLAYLRQLPIDTLKIDRSFVRDIESDPEDAAIIQAIIAMGHSLGLQVTAEGVESLGQLQALARLGCDEYQGYLFSKPLPAVEVAAKYLAPRHLNVQASNS